MTKIIKYSLTVLGIFSIIPISASYVIPKLEQQMVDLTYQINEHLPENYYLALDTDFSFLGGTGEYLLFKKENNEQIAIATIDFNIPYKFYSLPFLSSYPINGKITLKNSQFNQRYQIDVTSKDTNIIKFNGFLSKNGNTSLKYTQNQTMVSVSDIITKEPLLFIDLQPSSGKVEYNNHQLVTDINIPKISLKDEIKNLDSIDLIQTNLKNTILLNLKANSQSSSSVHIDKIEDNSVDKRFVLKDIFSEFSLLDKDNKFINSSNIKIQNISFGYFQNIKFDLSYLITVPTSSKNSLINFLISLENDDIFLRQGAFFDILKKGFQFDLQNISIQQLENNNILKNNFHLIVSQANENEDFTKRIKFNGDIYSTGNLAETTLSILGLSLKDILGDEISQQQESNSFHIPFSYSDKELFFGKKKASDEYSDNLNRSLLNLEFLLQEGEHQFNQLKNGTPDSSQELPEDDISNAPEIQPSV